MKLSRKITLASLAVVLGILSGVLTIVEKSINIANSLKVKTEASSVPNKTITEKGLAVGIETTEIKTVAKTTK